MGDWLESEFGAGVLVGAGAVGLLVGLTGGMENRWLFIALSAVAVMAGIGAYCFHRLDKDARAVFSARTKPTDTPENEKMLNTSMRAEMLVDGDYLATCREEHPLRARINGHGAVFRQARMTVKAGRATFMRDGVTVWSCSARHVARHFLVQPV